MSNEIRPLHDQFGSQDDVVLQIAVESTVETFTWLITKNDGTPVAGGEMHRRAAQSRLELSDEFSVTVSPDDFNYPKSTAGSTSKRLVPGDYQVRLYLEAPPGNARTPGAFGKLQLLNEDAFSISTQPHVDASSGDVNDVGEPIHVTLMHERQGGATERLSPVTYAEFRKFLEDHSGPRDVYDAADSWPTFGGRSYQALLNAARDFVASAKVTSFGDLLPPGYEEGKLQETKAQFPHISLPQEAGIAYLPAVELIWNYWLEEGMFVQTLNVILARFQNRRLPGHDPLARFDVTPLLPLRNRLWGYAEDELHRLTVRRRAAEYEYEYGFSLIGRAVPRRQSLVERRNGFISTFHQVLFLAHRYFKELDDLTIQADAFPLYRALRDCHIVLSQGTQNQYGEMAVAARAEFLVMQSILAEPQMREFLGGRPMTPYPEPWMDRVDSMKTIQGWADTSIMHFNDLATIGEQLVLTVRLGNWADPAVGAAEAATWAQAFRYGIQKYAAAYRTATGVDLSEEPNSEMPSTLLARRLSGTRIRA